MTEQEIFDSLLLELRRGSLVMGVLSQLATPKYGYVLVHLLSEKGMTVDAGTLYPLLRRLEGQGLLTSEWETGGAKPRKYYTRSPMGSRVYGRLKESWSELNDGMRRLLSEGEDDNGIR